MFGFRKIWGKCEEKKIYIKVEEKYKVNLKSINYLYIFLQIYFTYFPPLYTN